MSLYESQAYLEMPRLENRSTLRRDARYLPCERCDARGFVPVAALREGGTVGLCPECLGACGAWR